MIRKVAGIEFAGWDPTTSWLIAEARMTEAAGVGLSRDATGTHAIGKLEDGRAMRVVLDRTAAKDRRRTNAAAMSARRSSPYMGPTTGSTVPPPSPGSPT